MDNQSVPANTSTSTNTWETPEVIQLISNIKWRLSQLYTVKSEIHPDYFKHIGAIYAMIKSMQTLITPGTVPLPHLSFMRYIHQCILYDFLYECMGRAKGETPEYYKSEAVKRLSPQMLIDFLSTAFSEAKYSQEPETIKSYVDVYFKNIPWTITNYLKDNESVYIKTKHYFIQWFEYDGLRYYIEHFDPNLA